MKMKKFIAVLSVATMAAGLAVGCGSADSGSSDDKSSKGDWDSSNDITIVSREDGSGTRGAFIELFGIEEKKDGEKVDMTTDDAQITNSTSVMLTTVAGIFSPSILYIVILISQSLIFFVYSFFTESSKSIPNELSLYGAFIIYAIVFSL